MAEHKVLGFLLAFGLIIVAGVFAFLEQDEATPDEPMGATVAVAPPASEEATTTGAIEPSAEPQPGQTSGEPPDAALAGKILVSKRPVEVLAAPSPSASAMYGFPAGRPFRVIGREAGFVRIHDVRSGASGWIEEAALAPAPQAPAATKESTPTKKAVTSAKAKPSKKKATAKTETASGEPVRKRRGIFGGDGPLGGLLGVFGNR